ncbi:MAG: CehA/McbA family metallohydrolase, partial [Vicinamibacterales bacterium]
LLRGQELTTFHGHANVYGTSRPIDFRLGFKGRTMSDVVDDVAHEDALLSINHPGRETGDTCTGCGWDAPATPWDRIDAMEVVNGGVIEGATAGMPFWYARLNDGHRITAVGGSDDHGARSARGRIGSPATVVYAAELSEAALLDGIRSGRVYVRTRGPEGPRLELTAAVRDAAVPMGGAVNVAAAGTPVRLRVHAAGAAGQRAEIVRNGEVVSTLAVDHGDQELSCTLTLAPGQWVHVRLRDAQGITAFTNPVYARRP